MWVRLGSNGSESAQQTLSTQLETARFHDGAKSMEAASALRASNGNATVYPSSACRHVNDCKQCIVWMHRYSAGFLFVTDAKPKTHSGVRRHGLLRLASAAGGAEHSRHAGLGYWTCDGRKSPATGFRADGCGG